MRTLKSLILVALMALCGVVSAQTSTNTPPSTNSVPTPPASVGGLEQILGVFGGHAPTNISVGPFVTFDTKGKNVGYGVLGLYDLNNNIGVGFAVDSIPNKFTLFSGDVTFKLPVYPMAWTKNTTLSKFEVDPFLSSQVGKGIGGGSSVSLVAAAGANVPLIKVFGGELSIAGWFENLSGAGKYDGNRLGIAPNWHISF